MIAAQFATPETINFMATHARGLICLCLTEERADQLGVAADDRPQRGAARHRVHGLDRGARGRDDRHLRRRPQPHDPGRDRAGREAERSRPAGPRVPAAREAGRGARADRPDRGGGRPRPPRRPQPLGRRLRDHERRRDDGPRSRPGPVLRAARAEDDHGRRPRRVPPPAREARRARGVGPAADRVRRVHRDRLPGDPDRQGAPRARPRRGRRRRERARARPLRVPDGRRLPLAPLRLRRAARSRRSPRSRARAAASCSTWPRRVAASGC